MQTLDLKRNRATGTKLMIETRSIRREWIASENPNIVEVMDRFPLLKDLQIVSIIKIIFSLNYRFLSVSGRILEHGRPES